ncbi:MAG: pitrilysin family protein [Pseudomonadota bacterium]
MIARISVFFALVVFAFIPTRAGAVDIQEVTSPGGITAWLVEDYTNPLIALNFAVSGGRATDPLEKRGVSSLMASLLTEGAGDLDAEAYKLKLEETAVRLSFTANVDTFRGAMQTLSARQDDAIELMRMAVAEPRFDEAPLDRARDRTIVGLKRDETDPGSLSSRALYAAAFGDHPYGNRLSGTPETVASITRDDVVAAHRALLVKDRMKIGVVGAIDAEALGQMLDQIFGALPESSDLPEIETADLENGGLVEIIDIAVPQSTVQFGLPGLKRDDPDFITAFVSNFIFGGGSFSSRLYEEVREKRGLVYSVYSYIAPYDNGALLAGGAATENARVSETIRVITDEIRKMGETGVTEEELENAKSFLTGSYPLRFDTSSKIARQLVGIQVDDLGIDYIERRNDLVRAVTLEDVNRVAAKLYDPSRLIITIAGQPENVEPRPAGG